MSISIYGQTKRKEYPMDDIEKDLKEILSRYARYIDRIDVQLKGLPPASPA